jgi:2-oxoglutarate dehydrogenase E2 component (dihydrolipoamide succinyltransferase)
MSQIEIRLPKMGESVTEATITNWLKNVGDTVEMDEPLVEVATDKVDNELPSEAEGVLIKIFFKESDVVQVGDVIAIISTEGSAPIDSPSKSETPVTIIENQVDEAINVISNHNSTPLEKDSPSGKFYSPLVRSIAEKECISIPELESISGSGKSGRVTKKDILEYIDNVRINNISPTRIVTSEKKETPTSINNEGGFLANIKEPTVTAGPDDEIIEMDRMRRLIADHMIMSTHISPHVTSYVEADVTNIVSWRTKVKKGFSEREGENITFTPIIMEAIVKAIKDFPMVNISVSGNQIIKRNNINIGMATALPSGNLIVPVIKNADRLNLTGLTKSVNKLANSARNNDLKPEDIQGGTYTVTNVGTFGNVMGTPIINQPQVAILALGAIRKVPAVIETPDGDFVGIRQKMFLSHSYDHRVVDGALGGKFVKRVAEYLEAFDVNREF